MIFLSVARTLRNLSHSAINHHSAPHNCEPWSPHLETPTSQASDSVDVTQSLFVAVESRAPWTDIILVDGPFGGSSCALHSLHRPPMRKVHPNCTRRLLQNCSFDAGVFLLCMRACVHMRRCYCQGRSLGSTARTTCSITNYEDLQ